MSCGRTGRYQVFHGRHVVLPAGRAVQLALVHVGQGGGVNNVGGLLAGQHLLHLGGIGHVEGHEMQIGVEAGQFVGAARSGHQCYAGLLPQQRHQLLAQQAVGAGEEDFHGTSKPALLCSL